MCFAVHVYIHHLSYMTHGLVSQPVRWAAPSRCCVQEGAKADPREEFCPYKLTLTLISLSPLQLCSIIVCVVVKLHPVVNLRSCVIAAHFLLIIIGTVGSRVTFRDHSDWINAFDWETLFVHLFTTFIHLTLCWCERASVRNVMSGSDPVVVEVSSVWEWGLPSGFAALVFLQVGHVSNLCERRWNRTPEESPPTYRERERERRRCAKEDLWGGTTCWQIHPKWLRGGVVFFKLREEM